MSTQALEGCSRLPLFHAIEQARGERVYWQLPAPAPAGSEEAVGVGVQALFGWADAAGGQERHGR
ncbi:hypothetical protein [Streptomyces sp. NPDC046870]|uniref:hypothetical protein n=1 Tax=Streptomyces sp. NPDC046870 TaxID=3155135 RepID=UPI003451EC32